MAGKPRRGKLMERLALVDALDHLLNRGVVVLGESTISLANVDLVHLQLRLLLSSVETLRERSRTPARWRPLAEAGPQVHLPPEHLPRPGLAAGPGPQGATLGAGRSYQMRGHEEAGQRPARAEDAGDVAHPERGLAQLVLTLLELLRQLVERQAIRRMTGGSLPEDRVEALGLALMELESRMAELREFFGLEEEDLQLDLGPLGRLL